MEYKVVKLTEDKEEIWDIFVLNEAVNGTFLQTRRFLNYHPNGRFKDDSVLIYNSKGNLAAVCPGCTILQDGSKMFYSHKGSTFGGLLIDAKHYEAEKVVAIIEALESYLKEQKYDGVNLKITSDLFSQEASDLLQYCLYYKKYMAYDELNLMIQYADYKDDIVSNFAQGKRTNVHNCEKQGLILRKLSVDSEIEEFYDILCKTLEKYDLQPVHTVTELLDFKNNRLKEECEFYGIYEEDKMIAGSMMFIFNNVNVAHTQYLCALHEYDKLSPMTYMYYCMIKEMKERGFKMLSWGITSEHKGIELNYGLTKSKEAFGSKYSVSKTYYKFF